MARVEDLSDDVLYFIFCFTLPSKLVANIISSDFWAVTPVNLLLVCRSWHAIVASRPSLWGCIEVGNSSLENIGQHPGGWNLRAIERWIQRSASSSLLISTNGAIFVESSSLAKLLDIFYAHSRRLSALSLTLLDARLDFDVTPLILKCFPAMKALAFILQTYSRDPLPPDILDFSSATSQASSRLQSLIVQVDTLWTLPEDGTLSFPALRSLVMHVSKFQSVGDVYTFLAGCPSLVVANLTVLKGAEIGTMLIETTTNATRNRRHRIPILFQHLDQIEFFCGHLDAIAPIVEFITCPALRIFVAVGPSSFTPQLLTSIGDLCVRSKLKNQLSFLFLSARGSAPTDPIAREELVKAFASMLRALEGLSSLITQGLVVNRHLLEEMTLPVDGNDGSLICPLLKHIGLFCADDEAFDVPPEIIEDLIESRWKSGNGVLEKAQIRIRGVNIIEESERLQACEEEGLQFFQL